jgi:nicotinamide mononucleotide transporter
MSFYGLSIFDLSGTIISIFSVYCMLKKSIWYWYSGIICNTLWLVMFLSKSLYISSALQISYMLFSLYGIVRWKQMKSKKQISVYLDIAGLALSLAIFSIAIWNTSFNSVYNIIETMAVLLLIVANLLTAKEMTSCWYFWIIGDILFAIFLWHAKVFGMFTLQFVFLGFSIWGLYEWKNQSNKSVINE